MKDLQILFSGFVLASVTAAAPLVSFAQEKAQPGPALSTRFDARQAFETQVAILVKQFCIAMKQGNEEELLKTLDPSYLEDHQLTNEPVPLSKIQVDNVYQLEIAADNETVLVQIEQQEDTTSIVLLQLVERKGNLFVRPPQRPSSESGTVTPWLMHKKLAVGRSR